MHKAESILENEMHKILWDFEIKRDPPIPAENEKSLGDLKKLAVTQTPVKDHQTTLVSKTRKKQNNNLNHIKINANDNRIFLMLQMMWENLTNKFCYLLFGSA